MFPRRDHNGLIYLASKYLDALDLRSSRNCESKGFYLCTALMFALRGIFFGIIIPTNYYTTDFITQGKNYDKK